MRKIKIGFDLDGVIIDKPPFMPQFLMEKLVRKKANSELVYRYPSMFIERIVRWVSHCYIFRPAIKEKVEFIKKLYKSKRYELYIISSRYSFLEERTVDWLNRNDLLHCFKEIHLNLKNIQPHLFKEEKIKQLQLDYFIDDDLPLLNYLKKRKVNTNLIYTNKETLLALDQLGIK